MYKNINRMKFLFILVFSMLIFACEKDELPVLPHDSGEIISNSISMENDYRYQLFFDLETNSVITANLKTEWDLGFEGSESGFHVIMNTSKAMLAVNTLETNFSAVTDTIGLAFTWDEESGNLDSTAIGNWTTAQNVYVIDRGFNENGMHLGFKKIRFESVTSTDYSVRFANLDGTNDITFQVVKNANYNFTFLSLNNSGSIVLIEPEKESWDIVFTQYTHILYNYVPASFYLVTGVIANRHNVEIAQVFDKEFSEILADDIFNYSFSANISGIGYSWKEYDYNSSQYIINTEKIYIIKSTEGKYFKLHFIDFYNDLGVKGTPTFEFQEL